MVKEVVYFTKAMLNGCCEAHAARRLNLLRLSVSRQQLTAAVGSRAKPCKTYDSKTIDAFVSILNFNIVFRLTSFEKIQNPINRSIDDDNEQGNDHAHQDQRSDLAATIHPSAKNITKDYSTYVRLDSSYTSFCLTTTKTSTREAPTSDLRRQ
jgi:hypothetical protein